MRMTLAVRPDAISFIRANFSWLVIYYAVMMQSIDRRELEAEPVRQGR